MKVPLTYRPPSLRSSVSTYVDVDDGDLDKIKCGVPDSLSFDRILKGGTCPPLTTREFMSYLTYVEHSAENLQFLLWYKDYEKRFNALPESEKALSPEWTETLQKPNTADTSTVDLTKDLTGENVEYAYRVLSEAALHSSPQTPSYSNTFGNPFTSTHSSSIKGGPSDPFNTPPGSAGADSNPTLPPPSPAYIAPWAAPHGTTDSSNIAPFLSPPTPSSTPQTPKQDFRSAAAEVFNSIDQKWQPFTVQPFRIETAKIVALYLHPSSPRELNISSTDRLAAIKALTHTTHPSCFQPIAKHVEWTLRRQAHPNFIRWSIRNANPPRVWLARGLGIAMMLVGFALSGAMFADRAGFSRWTRGFAGFPFQFLGMATLVAGLQGMCVVLHGLHHRQLKPWELWPADEESNMSFDVEKDVQNVELKGAMDVEVKEMAGSHESIWREKYEGRFILRKVMEREERVVEPILRRIQDVIFIQSLFCGFVFAAVVTAVFVAVV